MLEILLKLKLISVEGVKKHLVFRKAMQDHVLSYKQEVKTSDEKIWWSIQRFVLERKNKEELKYPGYVLFLINVEDLEKFIKDK